MKNFNKYKQKLLKTAIISSLLIGIYRVAPLAFIGKSQGLVTIIEPTIMGVILSILAISLIIFLIWIWNLILENFFSQEHHFIPNKYKTPTKYTLSYLVVYLVLTLRFIIGESSKSEDLGWLDYSPFIGIFAVNTFIWVLINLIVTQEDKSELKLQKAELEISQLLINQEQLKQRIHPHFLFNALSTLQILIEKDKEKASVYNEELAYFLRNSLTLAESDILPLSVDLSFMSNYINLQKTRFKDSLSLDISIPDTIMNKGNLPVFALQILAENAVKHNSFTKKNPLKIILRYNDNGYLEVSNQKMPCYQNAETTGIGLKNLRERYTHFTDKLPITEETETHFTVKIYVLGV